MTLLQTIFDELLYTKKISNQNDLAVKLEVSKGYVSKLIQSTDPLPAAIRLKLQNVFNISREYLASNGTQGTMFPAKAQEKEYSYPELGNYMVEESTETYNSSQNNSEQLVNDFLAQLLDNPELIKSEEGRAQLLRINELVNSRFTKNEKDMMNRILAIMEHQNANVERITRIAEHTAETNQSLARTLETITNSMRSSSGDEYPKSMAS